MCWIVRAFPSVGVIRPRVQRLIRQLGLEAIYRKPNIAAQHPEHRALEGRPRTPVSPKCPILTCSLQCHAMPSILAENKKPARNLRFERALDCWKLGAGLGFEPRTFRL